MATFFAELIVLSGTAMLAGVRRYVGGVQRESLLDDQDRFAAMCYTLATVIVFFTAVVSCVVEFGAPRVRICTDGLIVAMCFWGWVLCRRLAGSSAGFGLARRREAPRVVLRGHYGVIWGGATTS